jgi:LacI family transcriptional regulator
MKSGATPGGRTTLRDVAQVAGVSEGTVSRALQGKPRMGVETRARIAQIAAELRYIPNNAARSLVLRKSKVLGLLLRDVRDPFMGQVATGFEQEAVGHGYSVIISNALGEGDLERTALRLFTSHGVDGVCVASTLQVPTAVEEAVRPIPVVFLAPEFPGLADPSRFPSRGTIRTDQGSVMEAVVRHLIAQGCQRLAYINGPLTASNRVRREAVARAVQGAPTSTRLKRYPSSAGGWRSPGGLVSRVLAGRRDSWPDALICYDDMLAIALLNGVLEAGVRVPEEMAVVGFDDIPFASLTRPMLTTVAQPTEEMGRRATRMLLNAIQHEAVPVSEVLPVSLVVRASSNRLAPSMLGGS